MKDIVWQSKLDGVYDVLVESTGPYSGLLTIRDGKKLLFNKPVSLAYGAIFGPDVADVYEWERMACEYIDSLK